MDWRDDSRIIWQDKDGSYLFCGGDFLKTDRLGSAGRIFVHVPDRPAEWDELLHRLAAVGGRHITGIEDVPRPIEVGDIVRWEGIVGTYEVRHTDGEQAMVRYSKTGQAYIANLEDLRHVEPDPEPEVRWIEKGETPDDVWAEMITAALDDGRRVECNKSAAGWVPTRASSTTFRLRGTRGHRYRMEAPADIDRVVWVCTAAHRLCADYDENWCDDEYPHDDLTCSRHPGHDGPHVACDPHDVNGHNLAAWAGDDQ